MDAQDLLGPDAREQHNLPAFAIDCLGRDIFSLFHTHSGCTRLGTVLGAT
jgi:hypothetical protein